MADETLKPNDLHSFWMPFTPQKSFKSNPRILTSAKGMYYTAQDGRQLTDYNAGLWCVNAGHNHPKITEAIQKQATQLDYVPNFQLSHPIAFEAANRLCAEMPFDLKHVFFSNSGSEAVDTALKIALAYQRARGKGTKTKFIGRERGYNGVGFGGISVGGIPYNRKVFAGALLPNVDHLVHTHNLEKNAFSKGLPSHGAHLADQLENIIALHDADNIAAVIIEPVAGSTGVLPPPQGYLEKISAICKKHDILLILDEVITAWGRLGYATAAERFNIPCDMITTAKGINNGAVPMGATFVSEKIYTTTIEGPPYMIELMHGYTYSGHPLACAAALATLEVYKSEGLFDRARSMEQKWQDALHSLKGLPHVIDIRNIGLMGAIELDNTGRTADQKTRTYEAFDRLFFEENMVMRFTGNVLASSPPLIVEEIHLEEMVEKIKKLGFA